MSTKPPPAADDTAPPADAPAADADGKGAAGRTGGDITLKDVRDVVAEIVPDVVAELLGADDGDGGDGKGGAGDAGASAPPATVEASVGAQVREELARIREHETLAERVEAVEGTVKTIVETPPRKLSRFTRAMWGGDD